MVKIMSLVQTQELGPTLLKPAPDFQILDHEKYPHTLADLVGDKGLLLGFVGDIWQPASMRRILWLQRHAHSFIQRGVNVALLIRDDIYTVYGFYISSPTPPDFPLLSDNRGEVHSLFNMTHHPGLVLLDSQHIIQEKWLMPDERVWPKIAELLHELEAL